MSALPMTPSRKISSTVLSARPSRQGSSAAARAQGMTTAAIQATTTRRGRGGVCVCARARSARAQTQTPPRPRRAVVAWIAAVVIPCALAAALLPWRDGLALSTVLLIFLLGVIGNALIGGVAPAAVAAVIAGLLANYFYTPPIGSLTITQPGNVFALLVFIVVGVTVASIVDRSAIRARQATQGKAEAQLVAAAATSVVNSPNPVHAVLEQARLGFAMTSVALLAKDPTAPNTYQLIGAAGTPADHARAALHV